MWLLFMPEQAVSRALHNTEIDKVYLARMWWSLECILLACGQKHARLIHVKLGLERDSDDPRKPLFKTLSSVTLKTHPGVSPETVSVQDNALLSVQQGAKLQKVLVTEHHCGTSRVGQCTAWAAVHGGPATVCLVYSYFFSGLC